MGSLYSDRDTGSVRCGKSAKGWSKYMKGASGRFAEYACRGGRRAIILTNPPPNIYSTRKWSNYRYLEEPILKGAVGGSGTARIEYAHPTVVGGATFRYQIWPLDESGKWYTFLRKILAKVHTSREYTSVEIQVAAPAVQISGVVVQLHDNTQAFEKEPKVLEPKGVAETGQNSVRKHVELERRIAQEKKEAKRLRVELERQKAWEKKDTKRKRVELERRIAQEKKEARRVRVELEQQKAWEKKEIQRERVELEMRIAQEKKEAKRVRVELEQQKAWEKKETQRERVELEMRVAQGRKEIKRKRTELEQQITWGRKRRSECQSRSSEGRLRRKSKSGGRCCGSTI
ncbi:hypothetical protein LTR93_011162 [Exophiala xenobiotica]|nr:hypothetical protein LTR93_011162 [Exophiala xenobiotica]